jgi:hypothetical protein
MFVRCRQLVVAEYRGKSDTLTTCAVDISVKETCLIMSLRLHGKIIDHRFPIICKMCGSVAVWRDIREFMPNELDILADTRKIRTAFSTDRMTISNNRYRFEHDENFLMTIEDNDGYDVDESTLDEILEIFFICYERAYAGWKEVIARHFAEQGQREIAASVHIKVIIYPTYIRLQFVPYDKYTEIFDIPSKSLSRVERRNHTITEENEEEEEDEEEEEMEMEMDMDQYFRMRYKKRDRERDDNSEHRRKKRFVHGNGGRTIRHRKRSRKQSRKVIKQKKTLQKKKNTLKRRRHK